MKTPAIIVNFKTYSEATGKNALKMGKIIREVRDETGAEIIAVPQFSDIYPLSKVGVPVFAQHIDAIVSGSHTGHILPEAVREAGAIGTLVNHSERQLELPEIEAAINAARRARLIIVVCANDIAKASAVAVLKPDFVAVEPPELIGSGIPVSKANPEIVSGTVKAVQDVAPEVGVLCGAGISRGDDVRAALDLGTIGVLLASGVVKAADPKKALTQLVGRI